jgi:hypothetical protein
MYDGVENRNRRLSPGGAPVITMVVQRALLLSASLALLPTVCGNPDSSFNNKLYSRIAVGSCTGYDESPQAIWTEVCMRI